jgi:hypothetical protein
LFGTPAISSVRSISGRGLGQHHASTPHARKHHLHTRPCKTSLHARTSATATTTSRSRGQAPPRSTSSARAAGPDACAQPRPSPRQPKRPLASNNRNHLHPQQAWGETASDARHPIATTSSAPGTTSPTETTPRPPPAAMPHAPATASSRSRPTGNTPSAPEPSAKGNPIQQTRDHASTGPATTSTPDRDNLGPLTISRGLARSHGPAPRQPASTPVRSLGPTFDVLDSRRCHPRHNAIPIDDLRARHPCTHGKK